MYATFKSLAALAFASIVMAGAGTASATAQPRASYQGHTLKIVKPFFCKNHISNTVTGPNGVSYTAKKCG